MIRFNRLRDKIVFAVVLYLAGIGLGSNIFLYMYLLKAVSAKAEGLDRIHLETVQNHLDRYFDSLFSLAVLCANDPDVIWTVSRKDRGARERLRDGLAVQEQLNSYLRVSPVNLYVDRLILSGGEDLFVQAQARQYGEVSDRGRLFNLPLYAEYTGSGGKHAGGFGPSISPFQRRDSYAIFFPVRGYNNQAAGFIYLEAGLDMVTAVFREYSLLPGLTAFTGQGDFISPAGKLSDGREFAFPVLADGARFRRNERSRRLDMLPLKNAPLTLCNEVDITDLRRDDRDIFYTVLLVVLSSLLAAGGMVITLSTLLTKPIQRLIGRINKIGGNDFAFDPEIEKSRDELGQIGRAVNQMSGSIGRLLAEMEESLRRQKIAELALLQTKINPHFLYNTLDSIQWMAKIQKNTGIADITRSLINLLRNIAVNPDDLITLEDELGLLEDYTLVMSLRFMGIFNLENRVDPSLRQYLIPKLTLQPLVENAIIHGIAPSGAFGAIVLEGRLADSSLIITVEDSGCGIEPEKLNHILLVDAGKSGTSFNTVGVKNVDERLRLIYGEEAGLEFESVPGKFTRVTVRLTARTRAKGGDHAPCSAGG